MTRQRIAHLATTVAARPPLLVALAVLVALATLVVAAGTAGAHVAPSDTENNRYLKLTLLPDRVRIAYTVFFGQRPGAGERQRMDRDRSGVIDAGESNAFGQALRDDVSGHLRLIVDGATVPASAWTLADVGLGTPEARGGAFAVDLVVHAPTRGGGAHTLTLEDTWSVPDPGETELRVEESPGVRVVASHLVNQPGPMQLRWAFAGNPKGPDDRALRVEWSVDDTAFAEAAAAEPPPAGAASAASAASAPRPRYALYSALALTALGALAFALLRRRGTA